ncbi:hypothetical protein Ahy_B08g091657 [Arachis hypogaea]|uniref:Retrotransposon gag domain-containing protein n=1 Tax=Arachis hypogaea TaxID=3818 RepID=A0A444Y2M3_ARAHY|nr:hypothetical protein Ahy_B08g091657 [Arachis hypogaea]
MEYHKEFLYLMDKANIKRSPEVLMDRFLFRLREELADTVQRYRYMTMDDLVKLAINWEQVQQMIDRHNKRNSSTPIFHSSSKPEMEEFVEYAVEGDVSLEDSTMQNFSTGFPGFVDSLVNYGGINRDEKEGRQITHFGQDGERMVGKIELEHMKDIATIQWVEKSHQTMVYKLGDWVWIPWRDEEHLMQDSRTNLFEEGENDTWSRGHFCHLRVKGQNGNLVTFKDLNTRRIIPCWSWRSRRPRVLKDRFFEGLVGNPFRIEYYDSDDDGSSYAKKSSQFQIPAFKRRDDPEAYFKWERKVESIFANCILSEEKKVQLVQANFSNDARRSRRRYEKRPISSWEKMKKIMRRQFVPSSYHMRNRVVPSSYHNEFFGRFCKLQQGSQSMMEYHKEFLYLMDKANIKRSPEVLMDRFLFGLREELADTVQRYRYTTMDDLVKLAINREQVQQMIDRHNKKNSSTPIFHSSSKPELEEFVEYAIEGDVSLEDSTVQNFSTGSLGCEQFKKYERKEIEKEIECLSEKNPCLIESESFERKDANSEREESMSEKETEFNKHTCERDLESSSLDKSALVSLKSTESLVSHTTNYEVPGVFISSFPGFVDSLVNYGGINRDEKEGR